MGGHRLQFRSKIGERHLLYGITLSSWGKTIWFSETLLKRDRRILAGQSSTTSSW